MAPVRKCSAYMDGTWWADNTGAWIDVINPAHGHIVARAPQAGNTGVERAVEAARRAWRVWRRTTPFERARRLHAIAANLEGKERSIATTITEEMGKPLADARDEVRKLARIFHYYAEEAVRTCGRTIANEENGFTSLVEPEPLGVVAAISPWNYPVELIGWKLAAALAAGCTVIVKPSEYTPSCATALFDCLHAAGVPPGVANLIHGGRETGRHLVGHPGIDKVAFTGSLAAGEDIYRTVHGITPLSLELGGNCPLIVTRHADLGRAVTGTLRRAFRNAGQICIAINRAYVHESRYEDFVTDLAQRAATLVAADGLVCEDADLGPMATQAGFDKVERHVRDACERGARLVCGGMRLGGRGSRFYAPTVLADCTPDMAVMHEETFGPVIGIAPFSTLEEAIVRANDTSSGLAAYAYTDHLREGFELGRALDFGSVAINHVDAGILNAPYGGRKQSGIGYEHGREGLEGYWHLKHLRIHHGT